MRAMGSWEADVTLNNVNCSKGMKTKTSIWTKTMREKNMFIEVYNYLWTQSGSQTMDTQS